MLNPVLAAIAGGIQAAATRKPCAAWRRGREEDEEEMRAFPWRLQAPDSVPGRKAPIAYVETRDDAGAGRVSLDRVHSWSTQSAER